jgi:hypothetical protein
MTIQDIETLITSVGFPIVMCMLMWKKISDSDEQQTKLITELKASIDTLKEAINNQKKED